jgi:hypothetical protein
MTATGRDPGKTRAKGKSARPTSADESLTVTVEPEPAPTKADRPPAPRSPTGGEEVLSNRDDGTGAAEKEKRPPPDWANFAPAPEPVPSRLAAPVARITRVLGHEWTLVVLGGLALSLVLNWKILAEPHSLPHGTVDSAVGAYLLAWGGHAVVRAPAGLWHVNAFFPAPFGFAYGDSMLGYAPLGLIGTGPDAAVLRYNLVFIAAQALAFIGMYALTRQLGLGRVPAVLAGVALAVAPWRLAQAGQLSLLSTGGIALALAMLARGHGVRWRHPAGSTPRIRPGWAAAGWLVAAWQLSLGFGLGLVFAYVLGVTFAVGVLAWAVRSALSWGRTGRPVLPSGRLALADGLGLLAFAGAALLLAQPYRKLLALYPDARADAEAVGALSPPVRGLVTAPADSLLWGGSHATTRSHLDLPAELALLPGFALVALAVAGLLISVWSLRLRLALLAGVVVSAVLALGTHGPAGGRVGYLWLAEHVPGLAWVPAPGPLIVWTTMSLALLAAGGVAALVGRADEEAHHRGLPEPTPAARMALLLPVALVVLEGLGGTPHVAVPPAPPALAAVTAPYLVLPLDREVDALALLWSTDHFADVANGTGGWIRPTEVERTRIALQRFPDEASVSYLRGIGVRTVVVLPDRAVGTPLEQAATVPVESLGLNREVHPDAVIFRLAGQ